MQTWGPFVNRARGEAGGDADPKGGGGTGGGGSNINSGGKAKKISRGFFQNLLEEEISTW